MNLTSLTTVNALPEEDGSVLLAPYGDAENLASLDNAAEFKAAHPNITVDDRGQVRVVQRITKESAARVASAANEGGTVKGRVKKFFAGLPIFKGHPDSPATGGQYPDKGEKGLTVRLEAREAGLFGIPVFNQAGADLLNTEPGLALSVRFRGAIAGEENGVLVYEPAQLLSVGLTQRPNLRSEVLNERGNHKGEPIMDKSKLILALTALGATLTNDASDDTIIGQLGSLKPRLDSLATITNERDALKAERDAAIKARDAATAELTNERTKGIDSLIGGAITSGRLTEAEKPTWKGLLTADFVNASAVLASLPVKIKVQGHKVEADNAAKYPTIDRATFNKMSAKEQADHCKNGGKITD